MSAKVNKSITIHQGKIFKLVTENITLANGISSDMDIIRHPGASAIIPLFNTNTVLLIKQYRYAIEKYIWEIPAGKIDDDESPLECAKRELIEETGYSAKNWQKVGEIIPVPGYSDEQIHLFIANDLMPARQNLDKDELLDVHEIKFNDAIKMIHRGEIQDSKTICGFFMTTQWLEQTGY